MTAGLVALTPVDGATLLSQATARTADITVQVPVEISKLPGTVSLLAYCEVEVPSPSARSRIGQVFRIEQPVQLDTRRSAKTVLEFRFDLPAGVDQKSSSQRCGLQTSEGSALCDPAGSYVGFLVAEGRCIDAVSSQPSPPVATTERLAGPAEIKLGDISADTPRRRLSPDDVAAAAPPQPTLVAGTLPAPMPIGLLLDTSAGPEGLQKQVGGRTTFGRFNAPPPEDATETLPPSGCRGQACVRNQGLTMLSDTRWSNFEVPVCWENSSSGNAEGRRWTRDAVERTWAEETNIQFTGWGNCPAVQLAGMPSATPEWTGIRVRVADEGPHAKELGRELAGVVNGVVLNFTFKNWGQAMNCPATDATLEFCIRAIAVHEFGHALGFTHEQNREDRPAAGCDIQPQGTDGDWMITSYDLDSVMNYCNPNWNGHGRLSELDIEAARRVYGSPYTTSHVVAGLGAEGEGAGVAVWDLNNNGKPDLILMANDAPDGPNGFRYRVAFDLDASGAPTRVGPVISGGGRGNVSNGAGVAIADINGNGRPELFLLAEDAPAGLNNFRYNIGFDLNADGIPRSWSNLPPVPGLSSQSDGAGIEVADLDGNGRPELILLSYENTPGTNVFRYMIGFDLDTQGRLCVRANGTVDQNCNPWRVSETVPGLGHRGEGAGIVVRDIDRDGHLDMILLANDAPDGPNEFRYRILWQITNRGRESRYGSWSRYLKGRGNRSAGAGVEVVDIDGDGNYELIMMAYDDPAGANSFRYDVLQDIF